MGSAVYIFGLFAFLEFAIVGAIFVPVHVNSVTAPHRPRIRKGESANRGHGREP